MDDCRIIWLGKYHQSWESTLHTHNHFQLAAILSGDGAIAIGDKLRPVSRGKIFLFPPHLPHSFHCDKSLSSKANIIDIKFMLNDEELSHDLALISPEFTVENFDKFLLRFEQLIQESSEQKKYSLKVINMNLYTMLVGLVREKSGGAELADCEDVVPQGKIAVAYKGVDVERLLKYVEDNYSSIISLDDLSRLAHVNKTTLIYIFKELYGTTPIKYINQLRMAKAKDMLSNTNANISEIAELIGFQSIYYFSRYFKDRFGLSPLEYRSRNADSKYFTF